METGTYLTEVSIGKENEHPPHVKFTQQNLAEGKNFSGDLEQLKKIRSSLQTINKDINTFLPDQYYSIKKVKPRTSFYRAILQIEERRKTQLKLPELKINMPETLVRLENSLELIYSERGALKIKSYQNLNEFMKLVKLRSENEQNIYSAVLMGVGSLSYTDFSVVLSNQLDLRILPKNQNQISIKFVQPYGDYPNMLRLFYVPKNIKGSKPNYAYKGMNRKRLSDEILEKKHKQVYNYLVDFSKQELIVTTLVRGKALEEVERMAQSIVDYLEAAKKVKITEIIVDFIFSDDKMYYFHEIKSIKSTNLSSLWDIGTSQQIVEKYKQQTNQITCKLCNHAFPRIQIKKKVTNKLIAELLIHLRNRGQTPFGNMTTNYINLSDLSSVCDVCYQIIVAEHQLIDIQQKFCSIVNVKVNSKWIPRTHESRNTLPLVVHQELKMMQWRIFFYIEKVKNVPPVDFEGSRNFALNMKFSDFKETFTKKLKDTQLFAFSRARSSTPCKRGRQSKISSRQSRYDKKSTLHTTFTNRSNLNLMRQNSLDFQKIKLITFYTTTQDISTILMSQELVFDLTFGNRRFKGHSSTLQHFTNRKECQRHSCEVLLFGEQYEYCLVCDGYVSTSELILSKSSKQNLFYSSEARLSNCLPLPSEWIQIISQGLPLSPQSPQSQSPQKNTLQRRSGNLKKSTIKKKLRHQSMSKDMLEQSQESFL